jgi:hypothetical protein
MAAKLEKTKTPGVFKRGNRYAVIYRDGEGHQRQESARTYDEARRLRSTREAAVAEGSYPGADAGALRRLRHGVGGALPGHGASRLR